MVHLDSELHTEAVGLNSPAHEAGVLALAGRLLIEEAHAAAGQRRRGGGDYREVKLVFVAARRLRALVEPAVRRYAVSYPEKQLWHRYPLLKIAAVVLVAAASAGRLDLRVDAAGTEHSGGVSVGGVALDDRDHRQVT